MIIPIGSLMNLLVQISQKDTISFRDLRVRRWDFSFFANFLCDDFILVAMEILTLFTLVVIGFTASYIGGLVGGGGGFISLGGLIFLGMPLQGAIATNRFGTLGLGFSTFYNFAKAKKIIYTIGIPLAVLGLIGTFIGAKLVVTLDEKLIKTIVGVLMLLFLPIILFKHRFGLQRKNTSLLLKIIGTIGYFFVALYDGFFGAGSGLMALYVLISCFGLTYIQSNATRKIPYVVSLLVATAVFAYYDMIDYQKGVALLLGMIPGGYLGSKTALRKGNIFVRWCVVVVVVAVALRLLLI